MNSFKTISFDQLDDAALFKSFRLKEGMRFTLRAEAFNSTNRVNFGNPNLSLSNQATFGELSTPTTARVMQFAARLDFQAANYLADEQGPALAAWHPRPNQAKRPKSI